MPLHAVNNIQSQADMIINSVGSDVFSPHGETLGQITEVTYNDNQDKLQYMIIGTDSFYGEGYRHFAIPVREELINITDDKMIIAQVSTEDLKKARGLKYEQCPDPHIEFGSNVYELFAYKRDADEKPLNLNS